MRSLFLILSVFTGVVLSSCGGGKRGDVSTGDSTELMRSGISFGNDTLSEIFNGYLLLKDALVLSDADAAGKAANDLFAALDRVEGCENTAMIAQELANSHDLALQRVALSKLSDDLIPLFQHADIQSGTIYVQHCPMFNEHEGVEWLSAEAEIRNPYYGDDMLTCGTTEEEIKPE